MRSFSSAAAKRVVAVVLDCLLVLLAFVGLVLGLTGSPWAPLWVLAAVLGTAGQFIQSARERTEEYWSPLGRSLVLRGTAATATAVCLATSVPGLQQALGAALGAAMLVGSIVVESFVARAARFRVPIAVRLPNLPTRRPLADLGPLVIAASAVATMAGLLIAALDASSWWWAVISLLSIAPIGVLAVDGRGKIVLARRLRKLVPRAVAAYAPDFVVYTSRPDDASYQVLMWLPYLQRAGLRFIIIARNAVPAAALAELTDVPVVEARGIADLDALVAPSLKAAFYVNASSGNGALVRFQHLTHIYLGHGDSDKPPSYNPTHAMYDQIFAAGPAATRRYAAHGVRIPSEKFTIVGRPQVEHVKQSTTRIADVPEPTVLYAPTWRGHVEETMLYSLPTGERIVSALLARGATVIFRPHPFSYDFPDDAAAIARIKALLDADRRKTGRPHLWGAAAEKDRSILDCINDSDAMVSDVSSVVSDYLFSGKPFAMIAVPAEPEAFVVEYPVARASYVVQADLADLDAQLEKMLGEDPLAAQRADIRADYLGDFPADNYAAAFVNAVHNVSRKPMEDMEDDQAEDAVPEGGREEDDRSAEDQDAGAAALPGRNWSRYAQIVARAGLDLGGTAIALLAFAAALARGPNWLIVLLAALSLWAVFQSVSGDVIRPNQWSRLLSEGDATRGVLVVTLAVIARNTGQLSWQVATACGMLLIAIVVERRIRVAWGTAPLGRNLPDGLREVSDIMPRGLLPIVVSLLIIIGFLLILGGAPAVILLGLAALAVAGAVQVTVRALRRQTDIERGELRLRAALEGYAPQFAVYFASTVGANYQVGMWLPYFVRIGRPFIIVTRTAPMLNQIGELCDELGIKVPLIYRKTLRSIEEIIVDSMTTAFYVNNAARNTHLVERRELTHVWLNHGDSEKPACFNPVHAIYDLIFAAGQAGIDRYARHGVHIPAEKFKIVGRPQVELISAARAPISTIRQPTVLYAPTWQGPFADSRVYSLPVGRQIVEQLLAHNARVIFRAHPFNYRYPDAEKMIADIGAVLDADREVSGREHLWGSAAEQEMSVEDCFNASDAMVSDVSAVVSDYLHSGKPFAMVSVGRTPEQLLIDAPAARAAYVIRDDLSNLVEVCNELLGTDPLAAVRNETKIYYLGDFADKNYADGFLVAAREVIDAGRRTPAEVLP
ncbi:MAG TPA: CDP-glycerol glycerophosphotransferase family protein [Propionibacteriaceae bacterium]|nr:CDP-glycerol glycerophosphotransferase family protein [Propionibacteriaceae bacterium]